MVGALPRRAELAGRRRAPRPRQDLRPGRAGRRPRDRARRDHRDRAGQPRRALPRPDRAAALRRRGLGGRARRAGRRLLVRRGPARRRGARRPRGRPRRRRASRSSRRGRASCRWTARARTGRCPCKHLAAVAYLAAEEFDVDPFALLRWRGRDRATLLAALRDRRDAGAGTPTALEDLLDRFHGPGVPVPAPPERTARLTPDPEALLDELPPLDVDGVDAREVLRPLYRRLAGPPVG